MNLEDIPREVEDEELRDELVDALQDMVNMTCPDMRPLWLERSRSEREKMDGGLENGENGENGNGLPEDAPDRFADRSPTWKTKYKSLAGWRHAVLWQELEDGEPPEFLRGWEPKDDEVADEVERFPEKSGRAMELLYFEEYPPNEPPYAWSKKTSPQTREDEPATQLRQEAMRGCWASLHLLEEIWSRVFHASEGGDLREDFLMLGMYGTLSDVLKFDDYRRKAENGEAPGWMERFEWSQPDHPNPRST
jgi:hypothetical protein